MLNPYFNNLFGGVTSVAKQIYRYYDLTSEKPFEEDFLKQDAIALNLQRACEQAIDLANYVIKTKKLGLPKESKESFRILAKEKIVPENLATNLGKMVGFRNVLVHEYQKLDLKLMTEVIENHLEELIDFTNFIMQKFK